MNRAFVLNLLMKILDEIKQCKNMKCAESVILSYIEALREKTYAELEKEIFY